MRHTKKVSIEKEVLTSVTCDVCGKNFNFEEDVFEAQEFHHIHFTGGYGSVFGDMTKVECDICQSCLYTMIKDYCRTEEIDPIYVSE